MRKECQYKYRIKYKYIKHKINNCEWPGNRKGEICKDKN